MQLQEDSTVLERDWPSLLLLFPDNRLRRYISSQLFPLRLHVQCVTESHMSLHLQCSLEQLHNRLIPTINFLIVLSKGYPAIPPMVHLLTCLPTLNPSLNDPRDLCEVLVPSHNITTPLFAVVSQCQSFYDRHLLPSLTSFSALAKMGGYHLGRIYHFKILKALKTCSFYYVKGMEGEGDVSVAIVVCVTETHFLVFKPRKQPYHIEEDLFWPRQDEIEEMWLTFHAEIGCLKDIEIIRKAKVARFTFKTVRSVVEKTVKKYAYTTILTFTFFHMKEFLTTLIRAMKRQQIIVRLYPQDPDPNSEEERVLKLIAAKEEMLKHQFNKDTIEEVHEAYRVAIEYYSNVELGYHEVYLGLIAEMYSKKDVKLIMSL